jgi:hypothetical protein
MDGKDNANKAERRGGISGAAVVGLIAVIVLGGALAYIAWLTTLPHPTPIKVILDNVRQYDGQAVTVQGTVETPLNLAGLLKVYEVTDPTGKITVVTKRGLPPAGQKIIVSGILKEMFNIAGISKTVIMEPEEGKK